jgi:hypothetical protein
MKKWFRARNILLTLFTLLALSAVGYAVRFAYRLNNACGPGDHIIRSEADAIKQAQIRISRARYGSHGKPGYLDEKPDLVDFDHTDNCCVATKTRNIYGVIIWEVSLDGETIGEPKKRQVGALMRLSNCGVAFHDSFIFAGPPR